MFIRNYQAESIEDLGSLLRKTNNSNFTSLQKLSVPFVQKGRDCIIETGNGKVNVTDLILPTLIKVKSSGVGIKALIISPHIELVKKVGEQGRSLINRLPKKLFLAELGTADSPRKEAGIILKDPDVVISTAERLIDHIRRGNIDLSEVRMVVIQEPEKNTAAGFNADLLFIYSKFSKSPQTLLFTAHIHEEISQLSPITSRPVNLSAEAWRKTDIEHLYIELNGTEVSRAISSIVSAYSLSACLVICPEDKKTEDVVKGIRQHGIKARSLSETPDDLEDIATDLMKYQDSTFVISRASSLFGSLGGFSNLIYLYPPEPVEYEKNLNIIEDSDIPAKIITFIGKDDYSKIEGLQERTKIAMKKEQLPELQEELKGMIQNIVREIKEEEDPEELNVYKKIIKRNVPIFLRSYFAAYLLKYHKAGTKKTKKDNLTSIFVGVGKNRRVFPRDLVQLFCSVKSITKQDIGEIKILDNYSFIEISSNKVEEAIKELNNTEYRGRKITVNYARKKER